MDIIDHFELENVGTRLEDLETPVPLIDLAIVERNLRRWQKRCNEAGFASRPHIKTHKLAPLASFQIALGSRGITVQKLGEAEVMAAAGIRDILLTFNVVGAHKLQRLADLAKRTEIAVVADNDFVVEGLAAAGKSAGRPIGVLVECDTGARRNGAQSPEAARQLARKIASTPGLRFDGLMTYPRPGTRQATASFLDESRDLLSRDGIASKVVSTGGTPDMYSDEGLAGITEYRAGTYVYCDRSLVARRVCEMSDCAVHVLATVVSRPTGDRAIIDAGSKSLTSDLLGLSGYGTLTSHGNAQISEVSEEHGHVDLAGTADKPGIGDLVRVLPNHVCPVSNLFDKVVLIRGSEVLGAVRVDARGAVH
jgi:D-serine deaminase-like pyridoxal phosphate-dependent protein